MTYIYSKTKSCTALVKYKVSLFSLQLRAIKICWLSLPSIGVFPSGPVFSHFSSPAPGSIAPPNIRTHSVWPGKVFASELQ